MNSLKYYSNRVKWHLLMPILRAKNIEANKSIFIFSEPRGGSTWLMEVLSNLPGTAAIFEPFHSHYGALDDYSWGDHFFADQEWEDGKSGIDKIINANKFDSYQLERTPCHKLLVADKLIFKCVMATPILPWIVENYKFKYTPIYILRHPLAVASSTLENLYKRDAQINMDHRWKPSGYNLDLYDKHKDLFSEKSPMIDQLLARWCINNHYTLNHPADEWITIQYEDMLLNPENSLKRIFSEWSIEPPKHIWNNLNKPSHSDFKKDLRQDKQEQLNKWINKYSVSELAHFQTILDRFGIDVYKINEALPQVSIST